MASTTPSATVTCLTWPRSTISRPQACDAFATGSRQHGQRSGRHGGDWYPLAPCPCRILVFRALEAPPAHEPVLQERGLPDPDRGRVGVLRPEADLSGSQTEPPTYSAFLQQLQAGPGRALRPQ